MARSIHVLSDAGGRAHAHDLAGKLAATGYDVHAIDRDTFPIADSMTATLGALASRCDLLIVVLSNSARSKSWIAPELTNNEALYPNVGWLHHFVGFAQAVASCGKNVLIVRMSGGPASVSPASAKNRLKV